MTDRCRCEVSLGRLELLYHQALAPSNTTRGNPILCREQPNRTTDARRVCVRLLWECGRFWLLMRESMKISKGYRLAVAKKIVGTVAVIVHGDEGDTGSAIETSRLGSPSPPLCSLPLSSHQAAPALAAQLTRRIVSSRMRSTRCRAM